MYNLFLEDGDLLESVEIMNLLNEEVITEASIAGMKITKENLEDEKFVKELIKKIDTNAFEKGNTKIVMFAIGVIATVTIIGAPIGILLLLLSSILKDETSIKERDLEKLEKCMTKTIEKIKKKKPKNDEEKKQLESVIKKLEKNRNSIFNKGIVANIKNCIDQSKYDGGIKVGNVRIPCEVDYLLSNKDVNLLSSIEISKETFTNIKVSGPAVEDIEALCAIGINNYNDLMKFIDKKQVGNSFIQNVITDYGSNVQKCLKNKKLCTVVELHEARIIYSYDDDCCYYWDEEDNDTIYKISVSQLLQASKQSYNDLIKMIKEYDK